MEQYFFKLSQSYSSKNKLDEEITNFLYSLDRTLLPSQADLESFKDYLKFKIEELHKAHPRCKKIELRIWSSSFDASRGIKDMAVACGSVVGNIFEVKRSYS